MRVPYSNEHAAYLAVASAGALGTAAVKGTVKGSAMLLAAPFWLTWRAGRALLDMDVNHRPPEPGWWDREWAARQQRKEYEAYLRRYWAWRAECDRIYAAWLAQRGAS